MPLTNAEKQKAHRQRQREKMARMEGALREIASGYALEAPILARKALDPNYVQPKYFD